MEWSTVSSNPTLSGQLLVITPQLIANVTGGSLNDITTVSLLAYQSSSDSNSQILTIYVATVPQAVADGLSAQILVPNSSLFNQAGINAQLASLLVTNFPTNYVNTATPSTSASDSSTSTVSSGGTTKETRTIIIAVTVTFGVLVIGLAAWGGWRATKSGAANGRKHRRLRDGPALRELQLGGSVRGLGGGRNSVASTSSSFSSGGDAGSPRFGSPNMESRHGASTSVDLRDSWWRFSSSSSGHGQVDMRENGHRRVSVLRTNNGQIDSSLIGR